MSSTSVTDYRLSGGTVPLHQRQDSWAWKGHVSTQGDHNHTPPLRHIPRPGDGFRYPPYGLRTPPPSGRAMDRNSLAESYLERYQYSRAPVVGSNAPPLQTHQAPIDNSKPTNTRQPFYNTYYSARRPQTPLQVKKEDTEQTARRRASGDANSIVSYLQIPPTINDSKGSLPEFAAQITCFFWFESSLTLRLVEDITNIPSPVAPLVHEAIPTTGFLKWVTTILSMTQVSQNVILLALMFIYRLKRLNPGVKGKVGSEFRLLTVALMLGNKFLDDNTYTNKTWAEVSGISVQEIHVMEVEFLSNMRYTLYASEEEWNAWHIKLGKFSDFYDRVSRIQSAQRNLALPSPFGMPSNPPHLPSPPVSQNTSPPYSSRKSTLPHPLSTMPLDAQSTSSPVTPISDTDFRSWPRKRSLDDHSSEPPSKRMSMGPSAASSTTLTPSTLRSNTPPLPRLPIPNLSISTNYPNNGVVPSSGQLPIPSVRAMSSVFTGPHRASQNVMQLPSLSQQGRSNGPSPLNLSEVSSRPSPHGTAPHSSATPSPTTFSFPQHSHTPNGLSPSGFPAPRTSPYKPIRGVNTLLVPPPSTSLQHTQNLSYDQMHYQPLGQPKSERRTGVLPHLPFNQWPHLQQPQHYLPRPSFAA